MAEEKDELDEFFEIVGTEHERKDDPRCPKCNIRIKDLTNGRYDCYHKKPSKCVCSGAERARMVAQHSKP